MLELYQSESCTHSETVRETMSDLGLSFVAHNPRYPGEDPDITNEQTHEELVTIGEEDAIPLLVDHQRRTTIAESEEIVAYLEAHYGGE